MTEPSAASDAVSVESVLGILDRHVLAAVLALDAAAGTLLGRFTAPGTAPSDRWCGTLDALTSRFGPDPAIPRHQADTVLVTAAAFLVAEAADLGEKAAAGGDTPATDALVEGVTASACAAALALLAAASGNTPDAGPPDGPPTGTDANAGDNETEPYGLFRSEMPDGALARQTGPPLRRLPRVRGRGDLIMHLGDRLDDPDGRIHVLTGPAGVGKTTVALALAQRADDRRMPVWWVSAAETNQLMRDMVSVASFLGAPVAERAEILQAEPGPGIDRLWQRLDGTTAPWLLVFDNADDPALLGIADAATAWARPSAAGTVLITTCHRDARVWGPEATLHPVMDLEVGAGAEVLLDEMRMRDHERAAASVGARKIADLLGGVPLALRGAGRYLGSDIAHHTVGSLAAALNGAGRAARPGSRDAAVRLGPAWRIALDDLEARGLPQARPLLGMLSYFAPERIVADDIVAGEMIAACGIDRADPSSAGIWESALVGLVEVGVIARSVSAGHSAEGVRFHPLVGEAARAQVTDHDHVEAAAVRLLWQATEFRDPGCPDDWPALHRLEPHVSSLLEHMRTEQWQTYAEALQLANRVAESLVRAGLLELAETLVRHARRRAEQCLGTRYDLETRNVSLLSADRTLAWVLCHRGRVAEAERRFRRLSIMLEDAEGPADPATLAVRYSLAWVLAEQGALKEARRLLFSLYPLQQNVLGDLDPATMSTRHLLAWIDALVGNLEPAEINLSSVLADRVRVLGHRHMDVFGTRYRLSWVIGLRGRTRQSEKRFRELARDIATVLGDEHPTTLMARSRVAWALGLRSRLTEAAECYRSVLEARERVLGMSHPRTLATRQDLACVLAQAGRQDEAEKLLRAVVTERWKTFGKVHVRTLLSRIQLASVRADRGRLRDAQNSLQTLIRQAEGADLAEHPRVLGARQLLGVVLYRLGRLAPAEKHFLELLIDQQRALGSLHRAVLTTRDRIAVVLAARGALAESVTQARRLLGDRTRTLGSKDPDTLRSRGHLATALADRGQLDEAREIYAELERIQRVLLEPGHPATLTTLYRMAWLAHLAGEPDRAVDGYRQVIARQEVVLDLGHPDALRTRGGLVRALLDVGRTAEAGEVGRRLLADQQRTLGPEHPDMLHTKVGLGLVTAARGDAEAAERELGAVVQEIEVALGVDHPLALTTREHHGWVVAERNPAHAAQIWEKIDFGPVLDPDHPIAVRLAARVTAGGASARPPLV